jgi:transcriptional regulator with XRE-family HTH domain
MSNFQAVKVGDLIRNALEREGRSQKWLADEIGVTPKQVSLWVNSDDMRISSMRKINSVIYIKEFSVFANDKEEMVEVRTGDLSATLPRRVVELIENSDEEWLETVLGLIALWRQSEPTKRASLQTLLKQVGALSEPSSDTRTEQ